MPDVRLSGDFLEFKAGTVVDLSNDEYSDALHACVVGKTYPQPVVGVERRDHGGDPSATVSPAPAAPREGKPPQQSYGDQ